MKASGQRVRGILGFNREVTKPRHANHRANRFIECIIAGYTKALPSLDDPSSEGQRPPAQDGCADDRSTAARLINRRVMAGCWCKRATKMLVDLAEKVDIRRDLQAQDLTSVRRPTRSCRFAARVDRRQHVKSNAIVLAKRMIVGVGRQMSRIDSTHMRAQGGDR